MIFNRKSDENNYDQLKGFSVEKDKKSPNKKRKSSSRISRSAKRNAVVQFFIDSFTNKEILTRVGVTLFIIIIFRFLSSVPLPGIDLRVYDEFFNQASATENNLFFSAFTGGQLDSPSIVGLGIISYINASIIMQLLTPVIPKLSELSKEGERGRQTINQITRFLTLPLAIMYSVAYVIFMARRDLNAGVDGTPSANPEYLVPSAPGSDWPTISKIIFVALVLTAGSLLVMWLSEIITERGIANGSSIIITAGILAQLPTYLQSDFQGMNIAGAFSDLAAGNFGAFFESTFVTAVAIGIGGLLTIAAIVFVSESIRKINIQYARRLVQGEDANLPIKLTITGVLPMIFASALLAVPQLIVSLGQSFASENEAIRSISEWLEGSFFLAATDSAANLDDVWYGLVYFLLIVAFGVFYAFIVIKPDETAENLQKSGGFIPGIRPGKSTENFISYVLLRIGFSGAIFLGIIALIPLIARVVLVQLERGNFLILSGIGGTSILIVVSVVIDTIQKFNSYRVSKSYGQYVQ